MKRVKVRPVGDLLQEYLRMEGLESPLLEHRVINDAWPEVVGPAIAAKSGKMRIFNQVLYVEISSAVMRQEVVLQRSELARKLNEYVDAFVIADIHVS